MNQLCRNGWFIYCSYIHIYPSILYSTFPKSLISIIIRFFYLNYFMDTFSIVSNFRYKVECFSWKLAVRFADVGCVNCARHFGPKSVRLTIQIGRKSPDPNAFPPFHVVRVPSAESTNCIGVEMSSTRFDWKSSRLNFTS